MNVLLRNFYYFIGHTLGFLLFTGLWTSLCKKYTTDYRPSRNENKTTSTLTVTSYFNRILKPRVSDSQFYTIFSSLWIFARQSRTLREQQCLQFCSLSKNVFFGTNLCLKGFTFFIANLSFLWNTRCFVTAWKLEMTQQWLYKRSAVFTDFF